MRVAIVQLCATDDVAANLERAGEGIQDAVSRGAEFVALPEAFGLLRREGAPIEDAQALERMSKVDTLIVDKTGTLTEGRPRLTDVVTLSDRNEEDVLAVAAALEMGSEHPLAEAIVAGARDRGLKPARARDFEAITGKGVRGRVDESDVALGNPAMMDSLGIDTSDAEVVTSAQVESRTNASGGLW